VSCKEDKQEERYEIDIVPHLHYVIPATEQEVVH